MLYLVNCEVIASYYMDNDEKSEMNHIVDGENEGGARDKVENFYSKKDNPYYVKYIVNINYCNEIIR